jgi:hypothetical protein
MSTLWIEQKYASLVGTQLQQFKVKKSKPYIAQFRCPMCGDSTKNKFKTRGHFYEYEGHINFKCFNCSASTSLSKFIKTQNPVLYTEYRLEILKETGGANTHNESEKFIPAIEKFSSRRIDSFEPFKNLQKISQLKHDHPAKIYVQNRKIPPNVHFRIYYSPIYYTWVNSIVPNKFTDKALKLDEPRIVFPFIDSKGYVFGFTGRSLSKTSNMRYSTIILDDTKEKVFGLETIDKTKNVYVVEGPIDSLFLDNCIAMAGADINLNNITDRDNITVIYDNEPRNKEIVNKISKTVDQGYKVCIWPDFIEQKDINDMILKQDLSGPAIQAIIDQNTYSGLAAKMRLQQWSKI